MTIELIYLETCLPDYFNGFRGHVYAIPVDSTSTYADVKKELLECISSEEVYDLPENGYTIIREQCNDLFSTANPEHIFNNLIEPSEDDSDGYHCYAYFGVKL